MIGRICYKCKSTFALSTETRPRCELPLTHYKLRIKTSTGWKTKTSTRLVDLAPAKARAAAQLTGVSIPTLGVVWNTFLPWASDHLKCWRSYETNRVRDMKAVAANPSAYRVRIGDLETDLETAARMGVLQVGGEAGVRAVPEGVAALFTGRASLQAPEAEPAQPQVIEFKSPPIALFGAAAEKLGADGNTILADAILDPEAAGKKFARVTGADPVETKVMAQAVGELAIQDIKSFIDRSLGAGQGEALLVYMDSHLSPRSKANAYMALLSGNVQAIQGLLTSKKHGDRF